jgi:hypothetical protein
LEPTILVIILFLIVLSASCAVLYFIVKAAVTQGIQDTLWNIEVSMRNAVKNGVIEALQELDKSKAETEKNHG